MIDVTSHSERASVPPPHLDTPNRSSFAFTFTPFELAARRVSLPIIEPSMELDTDEEELIVAAAARRRARHKARGAETLVTRLKRMVGASTCAYCTVKAAALAHSPSTLTLFARVHCDGQRLAVVADPAVLFQFRQSLGAMMRHSSCAHHPYTGDASSSEEPSPEKRSLTSASSDGTHCLDSTSEESEDDWDSDNSL
jgi:hypothetical protein